MDFTGWQRRCWGRPGDGPCLSVSGEHRTVLPHTAAGWGRERAGLTRSSRREGSSQAGRGGAQKGQAGTVGDIRSLRGPACSLGALALGEACCHAGRAFQKPRGGARFYSVKTLTFIWGLLLTAARVSVETYLPAPVKPSGDCLCHFDGNFQGVGCRTT